MAAEEIDVAEALRRIDGGARLVDVREQSEWDAVHAPQATLLPMSELQTRWEEIPTGDEPVVVVCHSGYRSGQVVAALERAGVAAVNLSGGMVAWEQAGAPVVRGSDGTADAGGERGHDH